MWYNDISEVSLSSWLVQVVDLFNDTLGAVMGLPVLRLFLVLLLFLVLVTLFAVLLHQGRSGRL